MFITKQSSHGPAQSRQSSPGPAQPRRLASAIPFFISLSIALIAGILLFSTPVIEPLISTIINIGLDPLRSQLIAALIMTAAAALIGAAAGRRKLAALLGAGVIFLLSYLLGFIRLEMQPAYDPGGHLEPLDMGALVHTSFVMLALGLLSAFIGSAVGKALGEVVLDPPYRLLRLAWERSGRQSTMPLPSTHERTRSETALQRLGSWAAALIMVALLVLAGGSGDLFLFSPDVGIHVVPRLPGKTGMPAHGTIVQESLVSPALGGQKRVFLIYLPPSYNTPGGQAKHYPALYLLHGAPGGERDWVTAGKATQSADTLIALGKIPELIIVMPDGNGRPGASSEWGNSFDQRQLMETFVAVDLVKYVDQKYRTIPSPADRAIGGLSMGGFGATNIAVHHPDVFGLVISLGGYYRAEGSIWGQNAAYIRQNSPIDVLPTDKAAWKLKFYLGAGTKDQPYYSYTLEFAQELAALHIPYHLDLQNGYHSWSLWEKQMYNALLWLRWG